MMKNSLLHNSSIYKERLRMSEEQERIQKKEEEEKLRNQKKEARKQQRKQKNKIVTVFVILVVIPVIIGIIGTYLITDWDMIYTLYNSPSVEEDYAVMEEYAIKIAKEYDFSIEDSSIKVVSNEFRDNRFYIKLENYRCEVLGDFPITTEFRDNRFYIKLENYRCEVLGDFPITTETKIGEDGETKTVITIQYNSPQFEEVEKVTIGGEISFIIVIFCIFCFLGVIVNFLLILLFGSYS